MPVTKYEDEGKPRKLPKKGWHPARLKIIADIGTVKATDPTYSDRRMMIWIWELVNLSTKKKAEWVQQQLPYNGKSKNLQKLLADWRGLLPAQILNKKFDIAEELLDAPAEISVIHSKDGKWANVARDGGIAEPTKKVPAGTMKPLFVSLQPEEFDMEEFKKLPTWIQNKAIESDEFIAVSGERSSSRTREKNAQSRKNRGRR